ncbi:hypothetical protein BT96DRAFT_1048783 [Gymnopus androsaceus JB14]|uniref:S-adenosyl-L-methionine-dependent methyltransferase n=1 Tax=Gymnopus androsaceus JB14 TaxID=1447944 RepID=A0A6A4H8G4_9AGAR|nr:hypothetical protein BT96DRAFT_1048783 [Gymnopus androsaceus JB14]
MNLYNAATSVVDWSEKYHNSFLITANDEVLDFAVKNCIDQGLPDIAVSAAQGKLLNLVAQSIGAKRILEVGTLGGIWMGRALPHDGTLITLEIDTLHAKVSREENFAKAGLENKCKVTLSAAESMTNLHPGGMIIVDNVVRYGQVSDMSVNDVNSVGVREMLATLKEDKDIDATTIATVGERAFDGFMYAIRK